ncbi:dihydrofolate reductase family protein [Glycomyces sp. TRM65418]|uniref:dihydrofolate reductase family protein n=1 Tax=Glycomyces sp. TRM65418 TaxID=2867006 RepID=UPI001CE4C0B0|nr:dihydrofolate reductase family protein [Glycomyces sp. TRM65418]MCC3763084.1 dihydrofolate reductase family protein [Glycomyces sp. TRM65418]QZD57095.1 dihydrofolate reductase family protein [Glycomyces sp. TRM65418]
MGKVFVDATVSLDGFIADEYDSVGPLFDWYGNGEIEVVAGDPKWTSHVSPASAGYLQRELSAVRAAVVGRHVFDLANGWEGVPPAGEHAFVVTHEPPSGWEHAATAPFTFVTEGVAAAVERAREFAGDGDVSVAAGVTGDQAIRAGVVDELHCNVVPVLLGSGKRYFGGFEGAPMMLDNPRVIEGDRVLHLIYPVRKA